MKTNILIEPYSEEHNKCDWVHEKFKDLNIISAYKAPLVELDEIQKNNSIDLLRSYNFSESKQLIRKGYIAKPSWILWLHENYKSPKSYLSSLGQKDRYFVNKAERELSSNPEFRIIIEDTIKKEHLDDFYSLYRSSISTLKNGVDLLGDDYKEFLIRKNDFKGIYIYHQNEIIGGVLCIKKENMLRAIYLATKKAHYSFDITRYLYYTVIKCSIQDKYKYSSLGADPSLYGHMVSIGLFHIKRRMGFKPIPSKFMGEDSLDLFEKVLRVDKSLDGVLLSIGYANNDFTSNHLDCYVYSSNRLSEKYKKIVSANFFENIYYKENLHDEKTINP